MKISQTLAVVFLFSFDEVFSFAELSPVRDQYVNNSGDSLDSVMRALVAKFEKNKSATIEILQKGLLVIEQLKGYHPDHYFKKLLLQYEREINHSIELLNSYIPYHMENRSYEDYHFNHHDFYRNCELLWFLARTRREECIQPKLCSNPSGIVLSKIKDLVAYSFFMSKVELSDYRNKMCNISTQIIHGKRHPARISLPLDFIKKHINTDGYMTDTGVARIGIRLFTEQYYNSIYRDFYKKIREYGIHIETRPHDYNFTYKGKRVNIFDIYQTVIMKELEPTIEKSIRSQIQDKEKLENSLEKVVEYMDDAKDEISYLREEVSRLEGRISHANLKVDTMKSFDDSVKGINDMLTDIAGKA